MTTRNCTIAAVGLFLAVSGAIALSAAPEMASASAPPATEKIPVTDSYHGVPVVDDYRWLENGDDPKVKAWVAAQNAYSQAYLSKLPQREGIVSFLKAARAQQHVRYADLQYAGGIVRHRGQRSSREPGAFAQDDGRVAGRDSIRFSCDATHQLECRTRHQH